MELAHSSGMDAIDQRPFLLPSQVDCWLRLPSTLALACTGGGKDGGALIADLARLREARDWQARFVVVTADLGRMEWRGAMDVARDQAERAGIHHVVVQKESGDLLTGMQQRFDRLREQGKHAPPFPSSAARYCTSGWKRDVVDKWIRGAAEDSTTVLNIMGFRAEESHARAKRPALSPRRTVTSRRKRRAVFDWHPILRYDIDDVWAAHGHATSEVEAWKHLVAEHGKVASAEEQWQFAQTLPFLGAPAYLLGSQRFSCCFCVLASENDHRVAAPLHVETLAEIRSLERESGFSYTQRGALCGNLLS